MLTRRIGTGPTRGNALAKFISAVAILDAIFPALRYLFYLSPGIVLIGQKSSGQVLSIQKSQLSMMFAYALIFCVASLSAISLPWQAWRDLLIGLEIIILLTARGRFEDRDILLLVCSFMASAVLAQILRGGHTGGELQFQISMEESTGPFESKYAFPMGAALIFFLFRRKVTMAAIVTVFVVLMFKRAAIGAILLVTVGMLASSRAAFFDRPLYRFGTVLLAFICGAILSIHSVDLAQAAIALFLYDGHLDSLLMGRYFFWGETLNHYSYYSAYQMLFGTGPGSAESWLSEVAYGFQLHNDYLKLLLEWGVFGTGIIFFGLAMIFAGSRLGVYLGLYQAVLFLTDNTLIYVYQMAVLGLLLRATKAERLTLDRALSLRRTRVEKPRSRLGYGQGSIQIPVAER